MIRRLLPLLLFMPAALLLVAQAGMPAKKTSYDSYRMVRTRNIFDPDRRAMIDSFASSSSSSASSASQSVSSKPLTQSDYVALNGILITEDKALAFFSGSRPEYNKVLPVQDAIVGARLIKITPDSIVVERDGKQITVAVGQTVPLDNSAPAPAPAPAAVSAPAFSSPTNPQTSSPGGPPVDMSEQAKRMMERRQKELQ